MRQPILNAAVAGLAAAFLAGPVAAQQPAGVKALKMQSTWPASLTLQDNFRIFAERVDKLTAGQIKIEALAAGQVVPAFEILDATSQEGDRWRPRRRLLLGRQEQGRDALLRHAGRAVRHGPHRFPRVDVRGRRSRHVVGVLPEGAEAQRRRVSDPAREPAGVRLVQAADQEPRRLQGHEVPPDRHRRRDLPAHGHADREHARRRDRARPRSAA